jgi:flavin-binding protein dodecin
MSVATVTQISTISPEGSRRQPRGFVGASKTLPNVHGACVKDMNVLIEVGNYAGYSVNVEVTFALQDGA